MLHLLQLDISLKQGQAAAVCFSVVGPCSQSCLHVPAPHLSWLSAGGQLDWQRRRGSNGSLTGHKRTGKAAYELHGQLMSSGSGLGACVRQLQFQLDSPALPSRL